METLVLILLCAFTSSLISAAISPVQRTSLCSAEEAEKTLEVCHRLFSDLRTEVFHKEDVDCCVYRGATACFQRKLANCDYPQLIQVTKLTNKFGFSGDHCTGRDPLCESMPNYSEILDGIQSFPELPEQNIVLLSENRSPKLENVSGVGPEYLSVEEGGSSQPNCSIDNCIRDPKTYFNLPVDDGGVTVHNESFYDPRVHGTEIGGQNGSPVSSNSILSGQIPSNGSSEITTGSITWFDGANLTNVSLPLSQSNLSSNGTSNSSTLALDIADGLTNGSRSRMIETAETIPAVYEILDPRTNITLETNKTDLSNNSTESRRVREWIGADEAIAPRDLSSELNETVSNSSRSSRVLESMEIWSGPGETIAPRSNLTLSLNETGSQTNGSSSRMIESAEFNPALQETLEPRSNMTLELNVTDNYNSSSRSRRIVESIETWSGADEAIALRSNLTLELNATDLGNSSRSRALESIGSFSGVEESVEPRTNLMSELNETDAVSQVNDSRSRMIETEFYPALHETLEPRSNMTLEVHETDLSNNGSRTGRILESETWSSADEAISPRSNVTSEVNETDLSNNRSRRILESVETWSGADEAISPRSNLTLELNATDLGNSSRSRALESIESFSGVEESVEPRTNLTSELNETDAVSQVNGSRSRMIETEFYPALHETLEPRSNMTLELNETNLSNNDSRTRRTLESGTWSGADAVSPRSNLTLEVNGTDFSDSSRSRRVFESVESISGVEEAVEPRTNLTSELNDTDAVAQVNGSRSRMIETEFNPALHETLEPRSNMTLEVNEIDLSNNRSRRILESVETWSGADEAIAPRSNLTLELNGTSVTQGDFGNNSRSGRILESPGFLGVEEAVQHRSSKLNITDSLFSTNDSSNSSRSERFSDSIMNYYPERSQRGLDCSNQSTTANESNTLTANGTGNNETRLARLLDELSSNISSENTSTEVPRLDTDSQSSNSSFHIETNSTDPFSLGNKTIPLNFRFPGPVIGRSLVTIGNSSNTTDSVNVTLVPRSPNAVQARMLEFGNSSNTTDDNAANLTNIRVSRNSGFWQRQARSLLAGDVPTYVFELDRNEADYFLQAAARFSELMDSGCKGNFPQELKLALNQIVKVLCSSSADMCKGKRQPRQDWSNWLDNLMRPQDSSTEKPEPGTETPAGESASENSPRVTPDTSNPEPTVENTVLLAGLPSSSSPNASTNLTDPSSLPLLLDSKGLSSHSTASTPGGTETDFLYNTAYSPWCSSVLSVLGVIVLLHN